MRTNDPGSYWRSLGYHWKGHVFSVPKKSLTQVIAKKGIEVHSFFMPIWLVISTRLKNISQSGNLPHIGVKIQNIWNHNPAIICSTSWRHRSWVRSNSHHLAWVLCFFCIYLTGPTMMYKSNEDDVVFLLPPRFRAFSFENPALTKKKHQNCLAHWPIVSHKLLKDFLASWREPKKTHGKISVQWDWNHGLNGWFVGTKFERWKELVTQLGRNSDVSTSFAPWKSGGCLGPVIHMMTFHPQKLTTCEWRNLKCPKLLPSAPRLHNHPGPSTE